MSVDIQLRSDHFLDKSLKSGSMAKEQITNLKVVIIVTSCYQSNK